MYRLPAPVLVAGTAGEPPIVWNLVRESATIERLRVRFRQLGATHLLYNYVSAEWLTTRYAGFPWDQPMLERYRAFARRHFEVAGATETCDFVTGGDYLFRVRTRPAARPAALVPFLPGTEPAWARFEVLAAQRRTPEMLAEGRRLLRLMPEIAHASNKLGHALHVAGDGAGALALLERPARAGMMDGSNLLELGAVAARAGRLDLAEWALGEAGRRHPQQADDVAVNRAYVELSRALPPLTARRLPEARARLESAEGWLGRVRRDPAGRAGHPQHGPLLASVFSLKGEACLIAGEGEAAAELFERALRLDPGSGSAARWREVLRALRPGGAFP
jgi:tetratricopeptide (TPR) repeat protein